jgi:hypothetical protein
MILAAVILIFTAKRNTGNTAIAASDQKSKQVHITPLEVVD